MKDQAELLRMKMERFNKQSPKTLAIVSGKGGVGKSNFSLNFSLSLTKSGKKVLLFDMDVGMGNIDILLGNSSSCTIIDFFDRKIPLKNLVQEGPSGLCYIAGGTGLDKLFSFDEESIIRFMDELSILLEQFDYCLFDMGAGVSEHSLRFILSVDEIILVTTPEPTSITDAYSMLKHIHLKNPALPFLVVVNRVYSEKEGLNTYKRLETVTKRFLQKEIKPLGIIPDDRAIQIAVSKQVPFIFNERAAATKAILQMAKTFENQNYQGLAVPKMSNFVTKLKRLFFER